MPQPTARPRPSRTRKALRIAFRVAVSVGLFALIYKQGGKDVVGNVVENLRRSADHPWLLVAAAVMYAGIGTIVRGWRWQALVRPLGYPITLSRASELFMVGTFFNQILPTGVGGDAVKAALLARDARPHGLGGARAVSTVLVDRAVGLLPLLAFGLVALPFTPGVTTSMAVFLACIGVAGVVGLGLLMRADLWWSLAERLPLVGWLVHRPVVARFVGSFAEYGVRALAVALGWGVVFSVLLVGTNAVLGRAVGIDSVSVATWTAVVPIVALSAMLPSIGGWGVREMGYQVVMGALTPPVVADQALAVSILFQAVNLLVSAVGGVLYLLRGDHVAAVVAADGTDVGTDVAAESVEPPGADDAGAV
ncbi:MAG: flippase-like domain-containing protein [Ardenticatenales bacterium]|nr:flippase-like domain-containing protein [Ardenticatenales bacterium]